ncbi:unnamed protein product, partial [marine sediment metagenome]
DTLKPTFTWQKNGDPDPLDSVKFDLYVSTNSNPGQKVISNLTNNTYTLQNNLLQYTIYYWKIVAKDTTAREKESSVWSFKTKLLYYFGIKTKDENAGNWSKVSNSTDTFPRSSPPEYFSLYQPQNFINLGSAVTFYWQNKGDPDEPYGDKISSYTFYYSTSAQSIAGQTDLLQPVTTIYNISASSFSFESNTVSSITISGLMENATVWYVVEAIDTESTTRISTAIFNLHFVRINNIPEDPNQSELRTSSGIVSTRKPTFQWDCSDPDPGDYIVSYTLRYSKDNFEFYTDTEN